MERRPRARQDRTKMETPRIKRGVSTLKLEGAGYGVFSGLALAPSPPPVPADFALSGPVALPGSF